MANLFIIGNGFDVAHKLKTKYTDFKDYLSEVDTHLLNRIYEIYKYSFERRYPNPLATEPIDNEYETLWKTFEDNMARVDDDNILIQNFDYGLEYEDKWIDSTLDTTMIILNKEFAGVSEKLSERLYEWISKIDCSNLNKVTCKINPGNEDLFLTFNYTPVLEEVYMIDDYQVCHIHGYINDGDRLIIGHNNQKHIQDLYTQQERYDTNPDGELPLISTLTEYHKYKVLIDYYNETLKQIDFHIENNRTFFNRIKSVDNIFVIGHSIGDADIPYFEEILKSVRSEVIWNIYYYNENEKIKFEEKIRNLGVDVKNIKLHCSSTFFN